MTVFCGISCKCDSNVIFTRLISDDGSKLLLKSCRISKRFILINHEAVDGCKNAHELQSEEEFDAIVLDQQSMCHWRRLMADDVHVLHMQKTTTQEHSRLVGTLDASQPYQLL